MQQYDLFLTTLLSNSDRSLYKLNFKFHSDCVLNRANPVMGFIYRDASDITDRYCIH